VRPANGSLCSLFLFAITGSCKTATHDIGI
jgi:hypothetical protein